MPEPDISIVTPSYNQSEYLLENIKSVKSAIGSSLAVEHIVIDGGSTDGTVELLEDQESEYNLRWISEEDRGQSHAVNKGINMAKGEWIGWQNSDDYYTNSWYDKIRDSMKNPEVDVIYGDLLISNPDSKVVDKVHYSPPSRWNKYIQRYWINAMSNQSLFVRKSVLDQVGELKEEYEYLMDVEFFGRLLESEANFCYVPVFIGVFRKQPTAKTAGSPTLRHQKEKNELYCHSQVEKYIPSSIKTIIGFCIYSCICLRSRYYTNVYAMLGRYI